MSFGSAHFASQPITFLFSHSQQPKYTLGLFCAWHVFVFSFKYSSAHSLAFFPRLGSLGAISGACAASGAVRWNLAGRSEFGG